MRSGPPVFRRTALQTRSRSTSPRSGMSSSASERRFSANGLRPMCWPPSYSSLRGKHGAAWSCHSTCRCAAHVQPAAVAARHGPSPAIPAVAPANRCSTTPCGCRCRLVSHMAHGFGSVSLLRMPHPCASRSGSPSVPKLLGDARGLPVRLQNLSRWPPMSISSVSSSSSGAC
jgi:hypothetical protein